MKQKKNLWVNLLFAAVVLVIAGVLFYLRSAGQSGSTLGAELIYGDANTVQKISLDQDAVYDIDTGYLTVHIEVKDGAARFIDSPCPDHICESFVHSASRSRLGLSVSLMSARMMSIGFLMAPLPTLMGAMSTFMKVGSCSTLSQ